MYRNERKLSLKKRTGQLISIILVLCLVFQLIPDIINSVDVFHFFSHTDKAVTLPASNHISNSFLNKKDESLSNTKFSTRNNSAGINRLLLCDYTFSKSGMINKPFDHRKNIRQSIPEYFHGSNNKQIFLIIWKLDNGGDIIGYNIDSRYCIYCCFLHRRTDYRALCIKGKHGKWRKT